MLDFAGAKMPKRPSGPTSTFVTPQNRYFSQLNPARFRRTIEGMTPREQLRFAAAVYRQADLDVYRLGFAKVGKEYRLRCYQEWIAAVIRFRREG
jgi:hypothetical protein